MMCQLKMFIRLSLKASLKDIELRMISKRHLDN